MSSPAWQNLAQVKADMAVCELLDELGISPEQCKGLRDRTMVIVNRDDLRDGLGCGCCADIPAYTRLEAVLDTGQEDQSDA